MKKSTIVLSVIFLLVSFNLIAQFSSGTDITDAYLSSYSQEIKSGDIDGDGDIDVVTLNYQYSIGASPTIKSEVYISENTNLGFKLKQKIITPEIDNSCLFMRLADINADSHLDLVLYSSTLNIIYCYLNNGAGLFGSRIVLNTTALGLKSMELEDLDNDGIPEIVCLSNITNDLVVLKKSTGFNFNLITSLITNIFPNSFNQRSLIQFSDVNGDGNQDVYALYSSSTGIQGIRQFLNNGSLSFSSSTLVYTPTFNVLQFLFVDINSDSNKDLIVAEDLNLVYKLNTGTSNYAAPQTVNAIAEPSSFDCIDVDGDGDIDVVYRKYGDSLKWCENNGQALFTTNYTIFNDATNGFIIGADVDNDGYGDVLYLNTDIDKVEVFYKEPTGFSFNRAVLGLESPNMLNMDVDNDGLEDVVAIFQTMNQNVLINSSKLVWFKNLGNGQFSGEIFIQVVNSVHSTFAMNVDCPSFQKVDLDLDGDYDLVYRAQSNGSLYRIENLGGGSFANALLLGAGGNNYYNYCFGDLDSDGDMDLMFASSISNLKIYKNNGNNNFVFSQNITSSGQLFRMPKLSDINMDGSLDIIFINYSNPTNPMSWIINPGNGVFSSSSGTLIFGINAYSYSTTDMDLDGDTDIILQSNNPSPQRFLLLNNGTGSYGAPIVINPLTSYNSEISWFFDINNDGLLDISYNDSSYCLYHLNLGNGFYSSADTLNNRTLNILDYDVDLDGDNDIIFTEKSSFYYAPISNIRLYRNLSIDPYSFKGSVFYDANQNGIKESSEVFLKSIPIQSSNSGLFVYTNSSGKYSLDFYGAPYGNESVAPVLNSNWAISSTPAAYSFNYGPNYLPIDSADFGIFPTLITNLIEIDITAGLAPCNSLSNYWVNVSNTGTTNPSGIVKLTLESPFQFISSPNAPDSIVGQNIYWHYDSLAFFSNVIFNATVSTPGVTSIGDTFLTAASAYINGSGGTTVFSLTDSVSQILTCAYDPNDKNVLPKGDSIQGFIPISTNDLEYLIRFQNTGTDTALNVVIKDSLNNNLDWNSLKVISSSHYYTRQITNNGELIFNFMHINLPDSGTNFVQSQGYIKFKLDLVSTVMEGDEIENTGRIYFDLNPAVYTNTTLNTIGSASTSGISEVDLNNDFVIYPNPFADNFYLTSSNFEKEQYSYRLINLQGKVLSERVLDNSKIQQLDSSHLASGTYFIQIYNLNTNLLLKIVKQ